MLQGLSVVRDVQITYFSPRQHRGSTQICVMDLVLKLFACCLNYFGSNNWWLECIRVSLEVSTKGADIHTCTTYQSLLFEAVWYFKQTLITVLINYYYMYVALFMSYLASWNMFVYWLISSIHLGLLTLVDD